jgi:hypothetical protein
VKEIALGRPWERVFLEIIRGKALPVPNVKGKPKIKDNRGALTAVLQVRILHRELKKCRKLACPRVNAPLLGALRVFRKDFDEHASLQFVSDPPDRETSR